MLVEVHLRNRLTMQKKEAKVGITTCHSPYEGDRCWWYRWIDASIIYPVEWYHSIVALKLILSQFLTLKSVLHSSDSPNDMEMMVLVMYVILIKCNQQF